MVVHDRKIFPLLSLANVFGANRQMYKLSLSRIEVAIPMQALLMRSRYSELSSRLRKRVRECLSWEQSCKLSNPRRKADQCLVSHLAEVDFGNPVMLLPKSSQLLADQEGAA